MNRIRKLKSHAALLAVTATVLLSACGRDDPAEPDRLGARLPGQGRSQRGHHPAEERAAEAAGERRGAADAGPVGADRRRRADGGEGVPQGARVRAAAGGGRPAARGGDAPERRRREGRSRSSAETKLDDRGRQRRTAGARRRGAICAPATSSRPPARSRPRSASDAENVRAQLGQARLKADRRQGRRGHGRRREDRRGQSRRRRTRCCCCRKPGWRRATRPVRAAALKRAVEASPATPGPAPAADLAADRGRPARRGDDRDRGGAQGARARDCRCKYFEALIAFGRKDLAKARELAQEVLKRAPGYVPALTLLGAIEFQEKHYDTGGVAAAERGHAGAEPRRRPRAARAELPRVRQAVARRGGAAARWRTRPSRSTPAC